MSDGNTFSVLLKEMIIERKVYVKGKRVFFHYARRYQSKAKYMSKGNAFLVLVAPVVWK